MKEDHRTQTMMKRMDFEARALPELENLYRIALYTVDSESDAEDLVEESFVRAYRSWSSHQSGQNCRVWLFRIMAKVYAEKYGTSTEMLAATNSAEGRDEDPAPTPLVIEESGNGHGQNPLAAISEDDLKKAVGNLPSTFRFIVVLSLLEDFTYRDIAEIAGIQVPVAKSGMDWGRRVLSNSFSTKWRAKAMKA